VGSLPNGEQCVGLSLRIVGGCLPEHCPSPDTGKQLWAVSRQQDIVGSLPSREHSPDSKKKVDRRISPECPKSDREIEQSAYPVGVYQKEGKPRR